ncbi:type II secretion system minor pseudopilin GspJ [Luteimonas sp. JM171]|uniref:type II secretion system minor pseudopilin GspJ n=1 Tax=Luteimonas sp. JM171 TaxID=1896164 RepID=UPI000855617C|nr:type II secretion system minor pseudopilin GspJ [Luteimonas sp. JM171]AOH36404.1 type II secretion system protein GspJ [Luteimonas sp. JM171]
MVRGFTLVEMLVALAVFALLAAGGVTVMAWASASQGVTQARMAHVGDLQRARALLEADLAQAAPRRTRNASGIAAVQAFTGTAEPGTGLLFALTRYGWENPQGAPRASLQYVEYRLQDGRLERSARPMLDGARMDPPQLVIDGVQGARVQYRFQGAWMDGWPGGMDRVPEAVRLTLDLERIGRVEQAFLMQGQWP